MSIDREALVRRHNPTYSENDPRGPLTVGNGRFAYTADVTGFQTLDGYDPQSPGTVPLCTMSEWGFHSHPSAESREDGYARLRLQQFDAGMRTVGYMSDPVGQEALFERLRTSPHRANLLRLTLGEPRLAESSISNTAQVLDLWTGALNSSFSLGGTEITTAVVCHPTLDALSVRIAATGEPNGGDVGSPDAVGSPLPTLSLSFPYPSHGITASEWSARHEGDHSTELASHSDAHIHTVWRTADDLVYSCVLRCEEDATLRKSGPHTIVINPTGHQLSITIAFSAHDTTSTYRRSPGEPAPGARSPDRARGTGIDEAGSESRVPPTFDVCRAAAAEHWRKFWTSGACVDFSESGDPRAHELERRIVLSQYLTAVQCAGTMPPPETGLTCNSWFGKFHLEMHPWHALHFPLWGRADLLEASLGYYELIAQAARDRAGEQGYRGLRWPKMTDPDGLDSPSRIGTLLCWQQPHFIVMCELIYQKRDDAADPAPSGGDEPGSNSPPSAVQRFHDRYAALVFETAEFMADYATLDEADGRYHLGPPLIPAQENHPPTTTRDPVFELEYWRLGLELAAQWKRRAGQPVPPHWEEVREKLAEPPRDLATGGYAAHAACPETYGEYAHDHPAMLLAFSYFAGSRIDTRTMSRTLDLVREHWNFESAWGWDFPTMAMCAARLGRRAEAVEFLLMEAGKNTYRANGHNAQLPGGNLPLYLPGNGALLLAVALLAGGWPGTAGHAPGFPNEAGWTVRAEGFGPAPW